MSQGYPLIKHISPEGREILERSDVLRKKIEAFWRTEEPESILGGLDIGVGRYSIVRKIDGIAVKVSSPTSSEDADEKGMPTPPENLIAQFVFQQIFGDFLAIKRADIIVPRPYFALHSPHNGYMFGQEFMAGWEPLREWARARYGPDNKDEAQGLANAMHERVNKIIAGTAFSRYLNDLRDKHGRVHGGNFLVRQGSDPNLDMTFCILDQPREHKSGEQIITKMRQRLG